MTRVSITRKINVRDPSERPAWRNALAQWQWVELAGTAAFSGAKPTDTRYGASEGRLNAWNGFAASGKSVYIAGMGGHADYSGNEAYKLDLSVASPSWAMLREPSAWEDRLTNVAYFADGRPNSAHLYYSLWCVGNEIIRVRNDTHWEGGQTRDQECVAFDLAVNDWTCATAYAGSGTTWPDSPNGNIGYAICQQPITEEIYVVGATHLHKRNPTTGVWTQLAALPDNGSAAYYRASAIDTTRNRLVIVGDSYRVPLGGLLYDITANTMSRIEFNSGDSNATAQIIAAAGGHSAWYDASLDRFILKTTNTNKVYLVNPITWAVAEQATTGGASITNAANGVFNKFVQVPDLGGFFYQPNHASNGWFLATE